MIKRGDRKQFKEFVSFLKENKHKHNQIRLKFNKLIEQEIELNQKGYMGKTLLHIAIKLKDKKLLQMFINAGVYIDLADNNGETPLHYAISLNRLDLVKLLIENGADVNIGAEMEVTPLHYAVSIGSYNIVKYLVNNGADYNLVDENNLSPLDYAIDEKNIDILKFFVDKKISEEKNNKMKEILERKK